MWLRLIWRPVTGARYKRAPSHTCDVSALPGAPSAKPETGTEGTMTRNDYIVRVPGEDTRTDTYNLLQAIITDDREMANQIVGRNAAFGSLADLLADVGGFAAMLLSGMDARDRNRILGVIRVLAEQGE
jgi:hypothetical protein